MQPNDVARKSVIITTILTHIIDSIICLGMEPVDDLPRRSHDPHIGAKPYKRHEVSSTCIRVHVWTEGLP